jgi:hypothetical protein
MARQNLVDPLPPSERQRLGVIDVETSRIAGGRVPKTYFWGLADESGYTRFSSTERLAVYLERLPETLLLCHSDFDILQMLVDGAPVQITKAHGGRIIRARLGKHPIQNTLRLFPVKLSSVLKWYGRNKVEIDAGDADGWRRNSPLLARRNESDCVDGLECFARAIDDFWRLTGANMLTRHTLAGATFNAAEQIAGRLPADMRAHCARAYRGGRVEVWDYRPSLADCRDISSSYPFAFLDAPTATELWRVEVNSKDWHCALFDAKRDDSLLFPRGRFTSYVFADVWERYYKPHVDGVKIKIKQRFKVNLHWLKRALPLVLKLYDAKRTATEPGKREVAKLAVNSCYGRLGLRGEYEVARIVERLPDGQDNVWFKLPDGRFLYYFKLERQPRANFGLAAYVTDNARGRLFAAVKQCGAALYCDTDSVFSTGAFPRGLCGAGLGKWTDKGNALFAPVAPKFYKWGDTEKRKGGARFTCWNLRRLATGAGALETTRTATGEMRKRIVNGDGTTQPRLAVDGVTPP